MKIFSDAVVTKADIDAIDQKQTEQIAQLRTGLVVVGVVAVVNLLSLAAFAIAIWH